MERPLAVEAAQGWLNSALLQELHGNEVFIPPLRERTEDIPDLVRVYLDDRGLHWVQVSSSAIHWLQERAWRGHLRELEHFLDRATSRRRENELLEVSDFTRTRPVQNDEVESSARPVRTDEVESSARPTQTDEVESSARPIRTDEVEPSAHPEPDAYPPGLDSSHPDVEPVPSEDIESNGFQLPQHGVDLADLERDLIEQALDRTEGNQSQAARLLGLSRQTLIYRMQKYGIQR